MRHFFKKPTVRLDDPVLATLNMLARELDEVTEGATTTRVSLDIGTLEDLPDEGLLAGLVVSIHTETTSFRLLTVARIPGTIFPAWVDDGVVAGNLKKVEDPERLEEVLRGLAESSFLEGLLADIMAMDQIEEDEDEDDEDIPGEKELNS